jgi:hypothetical protein
MLWKAEDVASENLQEHLNEITFDQRQLEFPVDDN